MDDGLSRAARVGAAMAVQGTPVQSPAVGEDGAYPDRGAKAAITT
jgi:hypothetical protein